MSEREDNVYKAKLSEQAERYDGKYPFFISNRVLYAIKFFKKFLHLATLIFGF